MDFGIARAGEDRSLTMTGTTMGSLSYMSPEQVKGEPTDPRSDLYSVGVSLYEFVTGQRPFVATSDYSIMAAHVKEAPKPPVELHPGLPAELNEIILMSIAKDPARRFQTADAFRNALSSVPVTASPVVSQAALDAPTVTSMQAPAVSPSAPVAKPATPVSAPVSAPISVPGVAKPAAANVPPVPMPPPVQPGGHRGLYMTLGALIVLAVLVVAGIYVPRSSWTHAKSPDASNATAAQNATEPAPTSPTSTNQPSTNQSTDTASQNAAPAAPANSAAGTTNSNSTAQPAPPTTTTASVDSSNAMQPHEMPPAAAAMAKSNPAASDSSSGKSNRLHTRKLTAQSNGMPGEAPASTPSDQAAASINSSLDRLQQQQAASGYGLRGDMIEKQASLKSNLFKAEEALQHRDMARAKKYADLAEADAGVLERFLGH
jgi:serine/threonine protein kinase